MKKTWSNPNVEELEFSKTMAGPGFTIPDDVQPDPDEMIHYDS
ncbi:paeninodin family lasso peptide [Alteribacter lacisalsi]|nr:paeninodin family lasso peptide [Alteribacter lacisalsi]